MIIPKAGKVLCVGRLYCDLVFSGVPMYECLRAGNFNGAEAIKHIGGPQEAQKTYLKP